MYVVLTCGKSGDEKKNEGCGETHEEISPSRGQETEEETEPPPDIIAPLTLHKVQNISFVIMGPERYIDKLENRIQTLSYTIYIAHV